MNQPLPPPLLRLDQRRDDDEPNPPWPWQPPASGQARRANQQQHVHLVEPRRA